MIEHNKVTTDHLRRDAYLYIRQSTLRQVLENTESTERQYALRQRAVALGWAQERIIVVDCDQGHSAASMADREGFQKLVTEVGLGRAGIVMGLEVSRLARNSTDWHRLLELCALSHTLILDEDGLYDPSHFNDRLLLGLKGTMSEAELHILKARLLGGVLNKARRGELKIPLPVGLVYDPIGRVVFDPDKQVQQTLCYLFETFRRTGTACATVRVFRSENIKFPRRGRAGTGMLHWEDITHWRVLEILHNPRYAGAFVFGRTRMWRKPDGTAAYRKLSSDAWQCFIKDSHPGYITWEQFEEHEAILSKNAQAHGVDRKKSPPREGPALLQGLAICGKCGKRMTVRYHHREGRLFPDYVCQQKGIQNDLPRCQNIPGRGIDEAIKQLLIANVTPLSMEVTFQVQDELQKRANDVQRLRRQHLDRARYEVEQAKRRYMRVDPDNRLVADSLEALWNEKLRLFAEAQKQYEAQQAADNLKLSSEHKEQILAVAGNFSKLWEAPATADRDRKRLTQLIIEDVTLVKDHDICIQTRFRGGATNVQHITIPLKSWQLRKTKPEVIAEIDRLLDKHCAHEIVMQLNKRGWRAANGTPFTLHSLGTLRRNHKIKSRFERLRSKGMLTSREMAVLLKTKPTYVDYWRERGLLNGERFDEKGQFLYVRPSSAIIRKILRRRGVIYNQQPTNSTQHK